MESENELDKVQNLETMPWSVDFWKEPEVKGFTDIMISPTNFKSVTEYLQKSGLDWTLLIENVGRYF